MTMSSSDAGMRSEDTMPVESASESHGEFAPPLASTPAASDPGYSGHARGSVPSGTGGSSPPPLTGDALVAEGKRWTEQLLALMGFEATLRGTADGDRVTVTATVEGDENLLAGERDEVRQAMQQILNRMINRGEGSRYHLQLEINDFWEKREADLRALAQRLAAEALESNGEVITDYLNAQERRIIHVTLREDARVKTYALGIGHIKRLAVAPADFPGGGAPGEAGSGES